jgi:polysaccharide biosynthesis transport protein
MEQLDIRQPSTEIQRRALRYNAPRERRADIEREPAEPNETGLVEYLGVARKRGKLIIAITAAITVLVAGYMLAKPNVYEAVARVQVDLENVAPPTGSKIGSVVVTGPVNDPSYFNTQLQNISESAILLRVIRENDLEHHPAFAQVGPAQPILARFHLDGIFGNTPSSDGRSEATRPGAQVTDPREAAEQEAMRLEPYVNRIRENLAVEPVKETRLAIKTTRLIDISYQSGDPQLASKIANSIADTFMRSNFEQMNETGAAAEAFMQKNVTDLQSQIRDSEEKLGSYAKQHGILSLDPNQNIVVERLAGLNRQLLEAENDRQQAESAYRASLQPQAAEALTEIDGTPLLGAQTKVAGQIADAEAKLAELRHQRAKLLVEATEEWPEVKEISQQILTLEQSLKNTRSHAARTVKKNLETRYRQTLAREQALRKSFAAQRGETLAQNDAAINYHILQQEIDTNKQLLGGLLQNAKHNDLTLAGLQNNIRVVRRAIEPSEPVGPKRMQVIALALVLSSFFGFAVALLLEYTDNTVRSSEDVERTLRLPTLTLIPRIGTSNRTLLPSATNALQLRSRTDYPELLLDATVQSPLAEAYRQLRAAVLLSKVGQLPKTLLVTSSQPGEGKTTTSVNVAATLAQTGARVLLIDADMRRQRLHKIFGVSNDVGLSTALSQEVSESEVNAMVQRDENTGLFVLPAGPVPHNPAELLSPERLGRLIGFLQSSFAYVIIDSPPIISFSDGIAISTVVDGVLLVVHGSKTPRDVAHQTRKLLDNVGAKILGVVLNNVVLTPREQFYYEH